MASSCSAKNQHNSVSVRYAYLIINDQAACFFKSILHEHTLTKDIDGINRNLMHLRFNSK